MDAKQKLDYSAIVMLMLFAFGKTKRVAEVLQVDVQTVRSILHKKHKPNPTNRLKIAMWYAQFNEIQTTKREKILKTLQYLHASHNQN